MEEEKKEGFFRKLNKNVRLQVGFFVVSMVLLVALYVPAYKLIVNSLSEKKIVNREEEFDPTLFTHLKRDYTEAGRNSIYGWVLKQDAKIADVKIVLKSLNEGETEVIKVKYVGDREADRYAKYLQIDDRTEGKDFSFDVKVKENCCYEIYLYVSYSIIEKENFETVEIEKKICTNQYFYNGEVFSYNPIEFTVPEINDEWIKEVICEGEVCGYSHKNGAWVFLHDKKLVWILNKDIPLNNNDDICIFLHFNTSCEINLPEERRQYGFDNYDFYFVEKETYFESDMKYRVAVMEVPVKYPITYVSTGHYDVAENRNYWEMSFRIQEGQ